jgi:hypothetical protein
MDIDAVRHREWNMEVFATPVVRGMEYNKVKQGCLSSNRPIKAVKHALPWSE